MSASRHSMRDPETSSRRCTPETRPRRFLMRNQTCPRPMRDPIGPCRIPTLCQQKRQLGLPDSRLNGCPQLEWRWAGNRAQDVQGGVVSGSLEVRDEVMMK
eukprot:3566641-Rhodomonas_salina.1